MALMQTYLNRAKEKCLDAPQWLFVAGTFFYNRIEIVTSAMALMMLLTCRRKLYKSRILKYMLLVYGVSLLTIAWCGYTYTKFLQQAFIITVMFLIGEQIILNNRNFIFAIFRKYIVFSYIACCLAVAQEVIWVVAHYDVANILDLQWITGWAGIHAEQGPLLRARAMCLEGGHLGPLLVPALIYLLYYGDRFHFFRRTRMVALVVAVVSVLTMSPIPILTLLAIGYLRLVRVFPKMKWALGCLGVGVAIYAFTLLQKSELNSNTDTEGLNGLVVRLRDTFSQVSRLDNKVAVLETNVSTAVLMSHLYSSMHAPSRIIGTGLGTHGQNYDRIYKGYKMSEGYEVTTLNNEDAYSLGIRLFSEFGIVGLGLFVLFLYRTFRRGNVITYCLIFVLIPFLVKGGTYFGGGMQFFMLMVYYSTKLKPETLVAGERRRR